MMGNTSNERREMANRGSNAVESMPYAPEPRHKSSTFSAGWISSHISLHILYLLQDFLIPFLPFPVKKPAPLVEISERAFDVRHEHFAALVAFGGVVMNYLHIGKIDRLSDFMKTTNQIEVLEVHEKPAVKKFSILLNLLERGNSHEHEAPRKARRSIERAVKKCAEAANDPRQKDFVLNDKRFCACYEGIRQTAEYIEEGLSGRRGK